MRCPSSLGPGRAAKTWYRVRDEGSPSRGSAMRPNTHIASILSMGCRHRRRRQQRIQQHVSARVHPLLPGLSHVANAIPEPGGGQRQQPKSPLLVEGAKRALRRLPLRSLHSTRRCMQPHPARRRAPSERHVPTCAKHGDDQTNRHGQLDRGVWIDRGLVPSSQSASLCWRAFCAQTRQPVIAPMLRQSRAKGAHRRTRPCTSLCSQPTPNSGLRARQLSTWPTGASCLAVYGGAESPGQAPASGPFALRR